MNGRVGGTLAIIDQQQGFHQGDRVLHILVQQRAQTSARGTEQCQARGQTVGSTSQYVISKRRPGVYPGNAQTDLTDSYPTIVVADDSMPTSDITDWYSKVR